jgi:phosphatidylethanolamine/phosphatidyl-N-methylethanolamine N-methyltransferase
MNNIIMFSKQFFKHPIAVSSITPSSKALSSIIVNSASLKNTKVVFEFGCGSGAITKEIVKNISKDSKFITFDINSDFIESIKSRYPQIVAINDSVENVEIYMNKYSINKVDVIISSLPWAAFSVSLQIKLMRLIYRILNHDGVFITYSYIHTFTFPSQKRFKRILSKRFNKIEVSKPVWANIPPAVVIKCAK